LWPSCLGRAWTTELAVRARFLRCSIHMRTDTVLAIQSGAVDHYLSRRIATVFGDGLATTIAGASSLPLPFSLNGTSVTIGGFRCPLYYVSPTQINLQVPVEVGPGLSTVTVNNNGQIASSMFRVTTALPGIFTTDGSLAILLNRTNALLNEINPAAPGEIDTMYYTGIGTITNNPGTGGVASGNPLSQSTSTVSLTVDGLPAEILFNGLAPGFVGLGQLNFRIPSGTLSGDSIPVVLTIDGTASKTVLISVGPDSSIPVTTLETVNISTTASLAASTVTIPLTNAPGVAFTATASVISGRAGWLTVIPGAGTTGPTGATVLRISATLLPEGIYTGAITINWGDGARPLSITRIPVTYTVLPTPISTTPTLEITATNPVGASTVTLPLTNAPGVTFTTAASVSSGPRGWLTITPGAGTTDRAGATAVIISTALLPVGTYFGEININWGPGSSPSISTFLVKYTVVLSATNSTGSVNILATTSEGPLR